MKHDLFVYRFYSQLGAFPNFFIEMRIDYTQIKLLYGAYCAQFSSCSYFSGYTTYVLRTA